MANNQTTETQNLVKFWSNTKSLYDGLATKEPSTIYFCSDTKEIFKGTNAYSGSVKIVDALPTTTIRKDTLYIIPTGESSGGYIYPSNGQSWNKVIRGSVFNPSTILGIDDIPTASSTTDGLLCCEDKVVYDNAVSTLSDIEESYPISIEESVTADQSQLYAFKQGETLIGQVSIPKTALIDCGSVVEVQANTILQNDEYLPEGKYLKLEFVEDSSEDIYIGLDDIIISYSSGNCINIEDNEINLNVDTSSGLTITDDKLDLDLDGIEIGGAKVNISNDLETPEKVTLEEAIKTVYQSSVWVDI